VTAGLPVMAGLVPAIHDFLRRNAGNSWMPGPKAGMTGGTVV
jgi:hypothetical protein